MTINPQILERWHAFSEPLEGRVPSLYLDVKGLITVGVGNLCNTPAAAVAIKGWTIDGRPATDREVREDWMALRAEDDRRLREGQASLRKLHWKYAQPYTRIRLPDAAIDTLVREKLASNVAHLRKIFPTWDAFPADAQLGILSIAWAAGPALDVDALDNGNGGWPNFCKFARADNWTACVAACKLREEGNPGVVPRNAQNRHCFMNAALVVSLGLPRGTLHWPGDAPDWPEPEDEHTTAVEVPHPGPPPQALAGEVSVAAAVVSDALRELSERED